MPVIALVIACALVAGSVHAETGSLEQRELEIYSSLINHGLADTVPIVVLAAETTGDPAAIAGYEDAAALIDELGVPAETLRNWQRRNTGLFAIDSPLKLNVSYQMLDAKTRAEIFADVEPEAGWSRFFARFVGAPGLLRLSRAGFDDNLDHALVYVEYQCGVDCGSGRLIHLANESGDSWQVMNAALVWMVD